MHWARPQCNDKHSSQSIRRRCVCLFSLPKQTKTIYRNLTRSNTFSFVFFPRSLSLRPFGALGNSSIPGRNILPRQIPSVTFSLCLLSCVAITRSLFAAHSALSLALPPSHTVAFSNEEKRKHICRTWFSSDSVRWWCVCARFFLCFLCSTVLCLSNGNNDHTN